MRLWRSVAFVFAMALAACVATPANMDPDDESSAEIAEDIEETSDAVEPMMQLTASDGTGLELVALEVRGDVQGPLGLTQLHLTFENPQARVLAGQFVIELPPEASLSRFAMKIGGQWQEGEVVERQAARRIYDSYLHRQIDPALLEKQAGNRFRAKVFPIPANGRKELIVSYAQVLDGHADYRVPLRGLPRLEHLDAKVFVDEGAGTEPRVVEFHETDVVPRRDLVVAAESSAATMGVRNDSGVAARVRIDGETETEPLRSLVVAFDTSASRAYGFPTHVRRLERLLHALAVRAPKLEVRVVAFDQDVVSLFEGPAADFEFAQRERLLRRGALGASNLSHLFETLQDDPPSRLLVVTDGVATAGKTELAALRRQVESLGDKGLQRIDVVLDAGRGSDAVLGDLVRGHLSDDGTVTRSDRSPDVVARRVEYRVLAPISVEVRGASSGWPKEIRGAQPGDTVMVYGFGVPRGPVQVRLSGAIEREVTVPTKRTEGPLIARALAAARIDVLSAEHSASEDAEVRADLRQRVVDLSRSTRVISDFTAMLVLESDWDYRRFQIDREAKVEILVVGEHGAQLVSHSRDAETKGARRFAVGGPRRSGRTATEGKMGRSDILEAISEESGHFLASPYGGAFALGNEDEDVWGGLSGSAVGESFGVGGLGLVGTGRGGGGTGEGTIGLGRSGLIGKGGGGSVSLGVAGHSIGGSSIPGGGLDESSVIAAAGGEERASAATGFGRGRGLGFAGRGTRVPRVRQGAAQVSGGLDKDIVRRVVRAHLNEVRSCYNRGLARESNLRGRIAVKFEIDERGHVSSAEPAPSRFADAEVVSCVERAVGRWKFPRPSTTGAVTVVVPFALDPTPSPRSRRAPRASRPRIRRPRRFDTSDAKTALREDLIDIDAGLSSPYQGRMLDVNDALDRGDIEDALGLAKQWHRSAPHDLVALIALGRAYEAASQRTSAARAYGSIIDLFPADAPMLRHASTLLSSLDGQHARTLATDAARRALEQRKDHPSSHRRYAWALVAQARYEDAFVVLRDAHKTAFEARYRAAHQILADDAAAVAALWVAAEPQRAKDVRKMAKRAGVDIPKEPVTRFVLSWETDANDVDLHVYDGDGFHAYYTQRKLPSGGVLYADVVDGYGPESFAFNGTPAAYPYRVDVHYFRRGVMGYGLGALQIIQTDRAQPSTIAPFVIMMEKGRTRLAFLEEQADETGKRTAALASHRDRRGGVGPAPDQTRTPLSR